MNPETTQQDIKELVITLRDQLNDLHTLNSYFYLAIEGLLSNEEILDKESLHGLWLNMRWLRQHSEQVKATANNLHNTIVQSEK